MATQLFLSKLSSADSTPPGDVSSGVDLMLRTTRDSGVGTASSTPTSAGPSNVSCLGSTGGTYAQWWFQVNAVTISGAITKNFWMAETNMSANCGASVVIQRYDSSFVFVSQVQNLAPKGTELPVTTRAAQNWAAGAVTSTSFNNGDWIVVLVYFEDAGGTMASGHNVTLQTGASSAAVDGDSYVTFTETITEYVAAASDPGRRRDRNMGALLQLCKAHRPVWKRSNGIWLPDQTILTPREVMA